MAFLQEQLFSHGLTMRSSQMYVFILISFDLQSNNRGKIVAWSLCLIPDLKGQIHKDWIYWLYFLDYSRSPLWHSNWSSSFPSRPHVGSLDHQSRPSSQKKCTYHMICRPAPERRAKRWDKEWLKDAKTQKSMNCKVIYWFWVTFS